MKKINYGIFLLITVQSCIFSQDTAIVKYFPLAIGNKWVYFREQQIYPGPGKDCCTIDSTYVINNHQYFLLHNVMYLNNGNVYSIDISAMRVDSITGNIFKWNVSAECLVDSLKSRIWDSAFSCHSWVPMWFACMDTSNYPIFGQNPKSKDFCSTSSWEAGKCRTYAKNFGIVYKREHSLMNNIYYYLRGCVLNGILYGDTALVGLNPCSSEIPTQFSLSQNYPNPFNPVTTIKFSIPPSRGSRGVTRLIVYDILGREITSLVNQQLQPGTYQVEWSATGGGTNYPSGVYFYQLSINNEQLATKKMVLIK